MVDDDAGALFIGASIIVWLLASAAWFDFYGWLGVVFLHIMMISAILFIALATVVIDIIRSKLR